jgi:hypothetical protein
MLDYRAWIIAVSLLLTAAGAYLLWLYRPKATYTARSLTAAHSEAKNLHVEGCREDFIASPGELIEPLAVPGDSLDQFRTLYGKEPKRSDDNIHIWDQEAFSLGLSDMGNDSSLQISVKGRHVVETLDGVELGLDSFGRIFSKMQDKKVEIHERLLKDDKNWTLIVTLYSACGRKFRSEYIRTLPRDPETDRQITQLPPAPGIDPGVLRSDVFMNKVVYDYTMVPSNGSNQSTQGAPSEHD